MEKFFCCFFVIVVSFNMSIYGDIKKYLAQKDSSFALIEKERKTRKLIELELTSQTWKNIDWKHRLFLIIPPKISAKTTAFIWVGGSGDSVWEIEQAQKIAKKSGCPVVVLLDVPNQPLFDDLEEDYLLSFTLQKALKTEKPDWILLFPMTKSVVRAMDAIEKYYQREFKSEIKGFVISGASKRGWTTWWSGCVDKRVKAIVPLVYDNLNMPEQMPNQLQMWGKYSREISEYTEKGLPKTLKTEKGKKFVRLVDPYYYRKHLTMLKIIVIATNDPYWPLNALDLYYSKLPGKNYVLYVPNNGHSIKDFEVVNKAMVAALLASDNQLVFPDFTWTFEEKKGNPKAKWPNRDYGTLRFRAKTNPHWTKMVVWRAFSMTKDFREATWRAYSIPPDLSSISVPFPRKGYHAVFAEAFFEVSGYKFSLASQVRIVKGPQTE